ncbi:hypothetical protein D9M69_717410 [compost metagenome]
MSGAMMHPMSSESENVPVDPVDNRMRAKLDQFSLPDQIMVAVRQVHRGDAALG